MQAILISFWIIYHKERSNVVLLTLILLFLIGVFYLLFKIFLIPYVKFSLLSTYENWRLKYILTLKKKSAVQYIISPFFLRIELTISLIRRNIPNAFEFFGCVARLNVLKLIST